MHLLRADLRSLDETAVAVDLEQSRADVVVLSFSDSDLGAFSEAFGRLRGEAGLGDDALRLASLADLRHPYAVDLYLEKVISHARFVLIRLLGGLDYWRYGVAEVAAAVRRNGAALAILPGDHREDFRLDEASTLDIADLRRLWGHMQSGGAANAEQVLRFAYRHLGREFRPAAAPAPLAACGEFVEAHRPRANAPRAVVVLYRSAYAAGDVAPYLSLADALAARGFSVKAVYVTSLKDPAVVAALGERLTREPPDAILNATAFSARLADGATVFDACDAPVFQVGVSLAGRDQWAASPRGLSPSDLAMNVALPEVDGRVFAGAVAFKTPAARVASLEYAPMRAEPERANIEHAAAVAAAWARLRRLPPGEKRLAFVLSDYPHKGGRAGYAVGLDTFASLEAIAARLRAEGFNLGAPVAAQALARSLSTERAPALDLARYRELLAALPAAFAHGVTARWRDPEDDPACRDGRFHFAFVRLGASLAALQPDRGDPTRRKDDYHDADLAPRHAFVAFHLWLREVERVDALVHCGAHGSLEWLPGKAVALSERCAPRALIGALPVVYPFIVNNPGEASQAKRRIAAVIVGHLTPPLMRAGPGAAREIEALLDEYAEAQALDPRRARRLAELALDRARETGLAEEAQVGDADPETALTRLDAWLCDLKEMRIGDGLHVFGTPASAGEDDNPAAKPLLDASPECELRGLLHALSGRRVAPGPGGAPSRGRLDVLPTGRNLYSVDPRATPTRTASELGLRAAESFLAAYAQDHGDWPRRVVMDLWGSSAMRTGGEDVAHALWLMGARPTWDDASNRVSGYEILSLAKLGRPRVDVTLRVSGLFRDVFPAQIALLDAAARAIAAQEDESEADNPLAGAARRDGEAARVFGAAPGSYGAGVGRLALGGDWETRDELGAAYLSATNTAFHGEEARESSGFGARVAASDAFVHVQDMAGQDVLDADAFAEHEGGFAAAAASLGAAPAQYHLDATDPEKPKSRPLAQEIARAARARAANPRWLKGQMRHGFRGAAEIAETVDNLCLFAATTDVVPDRLFDLVFDAVCGDAEVAGFLARENPQAADAIARRFEDALRRGLWRTRRNSVAATLQTLRSAA